MRIIEVIAPARLQHEILNTARLYAPIDVWCGAPDIEDRMLMRIMILPQTRPALMDALQLICDREQAAGIVISVFDAMTLAPDPEEISSGVTDPRMPGSFDIPRERFQTNIANNGELKGETLLMLVLSTIAATIGLAEDNTAVVIGSMIIAPLLGPIIAIAFAASCANSRLLARAAVTAIVSLLIAIFISYGIGWMWPVSVQNTEVLARTEVHLGHVVLALTAGAAGVLSLTTGTAASLVGVMVAVALLPPAAVFGLLLGKGQYALAEGALLLLMVNVFCVLLAANLVFLLQDVRPRRWIKGGWVQERPRRLGRTLWVMLWITALLALVARIYAPALG